jgi:hypothetical protein
VDAEGQVFSFRPEREGAFVLEFNHHDNFLGKSQNMLVELIAAEKQEEPDGQTKDLLAAGQPENPPENSAQYPAGGHDEVYDDEVLWQRAQKAETPGRERDIKLALECYRTLLRDFPESARYKDSQRRAAYLEKYFLDIR